MPDILARFDEPALPLFGYGQGFTPITVNFDEPGLGTWARSASDVTPPGQINDLAAAPEGGQADRLNLTWTATGDDGAAGTAAAYDLRYSTSQIVESGAGPGQVNFADAPQAVGVPAPQASGTPEAFTLTGLDEDVTYYVAIKAVDEALNAGPISNVPSAKTTDLTAPDQVTDLAAATTAWDKILTTWTAPGDTNGAGTCQSYDLRYSDTAIVDDTTFNAATPAAGVPAPSAPGTPESFELTGLDPETQYWIAIKATDEVPLTGALSNVPTDTTWQHADPAHIAAKFVTDVQRVGNREVPIKRGTMANEFTDSGTQQGKRETAITRGGVGFQFLKPNRS